jgi:hypothetical protein
VSPSPASWKSPPRLNSLERSARLEVEPGLRFLDLHRMQFDRRDVHRHPGNRTPQSGRTDGSRNAGARTSERTRPPGSNCTVSRPRAQPGQKLSRRFSGGLAIEPRRGAVFPTPADGVASAGTPSARRRVLLPPAGGRQSIPRCELSCSRRGKTLAQQLQCYIDSQRMRTRAKNHARDIQFSG